MINIKTKAAGEVVEKKGVSTKKQKPGRIEDSSWLRGL